jgi:hypothetical protein
MSFSITRTMNQDSTTDHNSAEKTTTTPSNRARRFRAAAVSAVVLSATLLFAALPADGALSLSGFSFAFGPIASGPFAALVVFHIPYGSEWLLAVLFWSVYFSLVAFTPYGRVHWSFHGIFLLIWNSVGLWVMLMAGLAIT